MSLRRDQLVNAIGADPITIKEFERVLGAVLATISGPSSIVLYYSSGGTLVTPLPAIYRFTLTSDGGQAFTSGISWGVTVLSGSFVGAGPTAGGTGTGLIQINSELASPTATIAVTARDSIWRGYQSLSVTISRSNASPDACGGGTASSDATGDLLSFNSAVFAPITRDLVVTLPAAVTAASLTASNITLLITNEAPVGDTTVEVKWQIETAPTIWADVGASSTSSPDPTVTDAGLPVAQEGVTCNRSATGLVAGSQNKFRLVARVSGGNVRDVFPVGTASVAS